MPRVQGCYKHTTFLPYILRLVSRRVPIARQSSIFLYWGNQSPDRKIDLLYVCTEGKGAWNFSHFQIFLQKKEKGRLPHGACLVLKVLCYSETELSSDPILWIASRIFLVVFSLGNATPLLYWRILLSFTPAYCANRLALMKSKSSKKDGRS